MHHSQQRVSYQGKTILTLFLNRSLQLPAFIHSEHKTINQGATAVALAITPLTAESPVLVGHIR